MIEKGLYFMQVLHRECKTKIKGFRFDSLLLFSAGGRKLENLRPFFILMRQAAVAENALRGLYRIVREVLLRQGNATHRCAVIFPEQSNL
jgi:hypothetical protein